MRNIAVAEQKRINSYRRIQRVLNDEKSLKREKRQMKFHLPLMIPRVKPACYF
jgi:hypothetical protein